MTEPEATFSACFGGAFLMWHPMKYASMLAEKMGHHGTTAWLVNTGCAAAGHFGLVVRAGASTLWLAIAWIRQPRIKKMGLCSYAGWACDLVCQVGAEGL